MDMAVVGEGSVYKDKVYARPAVRGYQLFKVTVTGKAHHSSRPNEGINASLKMAKILQAIDAHHFQFKRHPLLPQPTIAAGTMIKGGTSENVIPERCEAICDVRLVPGMTGEGILDEIRDIIDNLKRDDPEICSDVSSVFYWPSGEVAMTETIYRIAEKVTPLATGYSLEPIGTEGSNDTCWLNNVAGIPAIAFGPGDNYLSGEHGPDEWVSIARLIDFAKIYALMAIEACGVESR
jgi:acetylornithine deacetylase/succinyl-diaminopimelate desuccinylase-like protein